jgi:hypothetical protein
MEEMDYMMALFEEAMEEEQLAKDDDRNLQNMVPTIHNAGGMDGGLDGGMGGRNRSGMGGGNQGGMGKMGGGTSGGGMFGGSGK